MCFPKFKIILYILQIIRAGTQHFLQACNALTEDLDEPALQRRLIRVCCPSEDVLGPCLQTDAQDCFDAPMSPIYYNDKPPSVRCDSNDRQAG